jgi:hypothetical protein
VNRMVPEIVRIGVANARIKRVTPRDRVEYLDEAGQEFFVDLKECARNWVQLHNKDDGDLVLLTTQDIFDSYDSSFVAQRGLLDDPPWVEFTNKRRTRFEFGSYKEARSLLRSLRGGAGVRTIRKPCIPDSHRMTRVMNS